jgi:hypothetical protein
MSHLKSMYTFLEGFLTEKAGEKKMSARSGPLDHPCAASHVSSTAPVLQRPRARAGGSTHVVSG